MCAEPTPGKFARIQAIDEAEGRLVEDRYCQVV